MKKNKKKMVVYTKKRNFVLRMFSNKFSYFPRNTFDGTKNHSKITGFIKLRLLSNEPQKLLYCKMLCETSLLAGGGYCYKFILPVSPMCLRVQKAKFRCRLLSDNVGYKVEYFGSL